MGHKPSRSSGTHNLLDHLGLNPKEDTSKEAYLHQVKKDNVLLYDITECIKNGQNPFTQQEESDSIFTIYYIFTISSQAKQRRRRQRIFYLSYYSKRKVHLKGIQLRLKSPPSNKKYSHLPPNPSK